MTLRKNQLSRFAGIAALGVAIMGTSASCGEDLKDAACNSECEAEGFAEGNASITGVASVDGFFQSAINFTGTANNITANLKAELDGLRADLELPAGEADIVGAFKAKLQTEFQAQVKVEAQPPRCEIDAKVSIEASAKCQAEANCEVMADPGSASFECKGGCEVEASAMVDCGVDATASCTFQGPAVACQGTCEGTCTVEAGVEGGCEGSCDGNCTGTCNGSTSDGAACNGTCEGTCSGSCRIEGSVAAQCNGTCSGSCTVTGPMLDCTAAVEAKCEANADASVQCNGSCDGEFTPPMVSASCEAKASCDASAKADASVQVECKPPSLDVKVVVAAEANLSVEARAKLDFQIAAFKARVPRILAAIKKGDIVFDAGADLVAAGQGAVEGGLQAFADGDVSVSAKFKLITCAPSEFKAAGTAVDKATKALKAQLDAASSVNIQNLAS